MNTLELLYNKALIKEAADKAENIKKAKVWRDLNFMKIYDLKVIKNMWCLEYVNAMCTQYWLMIRIDK